MTKIILTMIAVLPYLLCCKEQVPELKIIKSGSQIDSVLVGGSTQITYTLENTSGSEVIISDYDLSCTCTKTSLTKNTVIPARTSKTITFEIDGKRLQKGYQSSVTVGIKTNTQPSLHMLEMKIVAI